MDSLIDIIGEHFLLYAFRCPSDSFNYENFIFLFIPLDEFSVR